MDTPPVTLGPVEQRRLYILTKLLAGRLTTIETALTLDLSIRHLKVMVDLPARPDMPPMTCDSLVRLPTRSKAVLRVGHRWR